MQGDYVWSLKLSFFQISLDGVELNDYELSVSSFFYSNFLIYKLFMTAAFTVMVIVLSMVWMVVLYLMLSSVTRYGDDMTVTSD